MLDRGEVLFEQGQEIGIGSARQHLGDERATRRQVLDREIGGGLDQAHCTQMISLFVADCIGGHIRQDQIGRAIQCFG